MRAEKKLKRVRAHIRYKNAAGKHVPGTTTVCGLRAKPALVAAANRLGLQGVDSSQMWSALAGVGTLVHALILADFKGETFNTNEFSLLEIELAENAMVKVYDWKKKHDLEPILLEQQLVSEAYQIGLTVDYYGKVDGVLEVLDFKTGDRIFPDVRYQLAGYWLGLEDCGYPVERARVVRVGRDEGEGFDEPFWTNLDGPKRGFLHLRAIYELERKRDEQNLALLEDFKQLLT